MMTMVEEWLCRNDCFGRRYWDAEVTAMAGTIRVPRLKLMAGAIGMQRYSRSGRMKGDTEATVVAG